MKLKKVLLTIAAISVCSSAFSASNSVLAQGGTYVGLAAGWGQIATESAGGVAAWLGRTNLSSGGFAGRVYAGYLLPMVGSSWLLGPELGYSYYQGNSYTVYNGMGYGDNLNVKQSGYGLDILLNATYLLSNSISLGIKPGFQYAAQKYTSNDATGGYFPASLTENRIAPEVNVEATWQAFSDTPLFVGASYQYVFGDNADDSFDRAYRGYASVTSREMLAINLEYLFN